MGDKDMARKTMKEAGVPIIPGCDLVENVAQAKEEAAKVGFPLLLKARSGGGGRGIRLVNSLEEVESAYNSATTEAEAAFGDGAMYIEKYLRPVKHIETQILGDSHGNVVCLGERDCSIQRRNQKLIEETPSVLLSEETRQRLIEASIKAGKFVGYCGAGTVEYLYEPKSGEFYFMEMNTRLQVEHPVTEMVTGVDLVKWQIRVASGEPLGFEQQDMEWRGHAIECRINAEDPSQDFRPACGTIETLHTPGGFGVRFDSAMYQGYSIPPFYDSMIGKLIVYDLTREEAMRKMKAALCELNLDGITHNATFQEEMLEWPDFVNASYTTDLLEKMLK